MLFDTMEGKKHIHIGKEPNYALYGQFYDLRDAVEKLPIPEKEKNERLEELSLLTILCNRPRFEGANHAAKELDALQYRYYPEYTYDR